MRLRVHSGIDDVDAGEWSAVTAAAGAPAFYDYRYLRAYERAPLQDTAAFFYLLAGAPAVAVLPAYLQSTDDPLGQLPTLGLPGREPGDAILVSHEAHCYDTQLPAMPGALTPELASLLTQTLAGLAQQAGAKWFVFLNVAAAGPAARALAAAGLRQVPQNTRYHRDLTGYPAVEDLVDAIPGRKARFALRRSQRQAVQAGLTVTRPDPAGGAAQVVELCRRTTARHGTSEYYPAAFHEFVARAAEVVTVTEVRLRGELASGTVCLLDPRRYHLWAGGIDYQVTAGIHSAFPLMLWPALEEAIARGRPVFEAGRGNGEAKLRYQLDPVPLSAFIGDA